jgi:serine O-acetyltransferase
MKWLEQMSFLGADLKRWKCASVKDLFYMFFEQAVWATVIYRVSRMLFLIDIPILKIFLRLAGFFLMKFSEYFLGAVIKPEAAIGPGLFISHTGIIRIHPKTTAGKNLSITVGVLLGEKGLGGKGAPIIGDNVFFGAGAKVLGTIRIGNNAKIGANAVVTRDIPDNATAVGVPARVLPNNKDK